MPRFSGLRADARAVDAVGSMVPCDSAPGGTDAGARRAPVAVKEWSDTGVPLEGLTGSSSTPTFIGHGTNNMLSIIK
ncbi:hypothetical protein KACC15558_04510 [Brevibacterium ammoniilyticum]|uniref:Uncharacterized protein n=1 Tax=Brevibacterium ammoniilyticum TaxID=1046555 RepID=A0ABP9U3D0_9MICO